MSRYALLALAVLIGGCLVADEPSLEETTNFLHEKIEGAKIERNQIDGADRLYRMWYQTLFEASGCDVHWTASNIEEVDLNYQTANRKENEYDFHFSLQQLDPTEIKVTDISELNVAVVELAFRSPIQKTVNGEEIESRHESMIVSEHDLAERLVKAFIHGANLCGAKASPF